MNRSDGSRKPTPANLAGTRRTLPSTGVVLSTRVRYAEDGHRHAPRRWLSAEAGAQLRAWRVRAGLRRAELAELVGCGRSFVIRIENGRRVPGPTAAEGLVRALGLDEGEAAWVRGLVGKPGVTSVEGA